MVTWLRRLSPERRFGGSIPPRADVLETGDVGGDKLSGLPRHVGEPRRADVLCGERRTGLEFEVFRA